MTESKIEKRAKFLALIRQGNESEAEGPLCTPVIPCNKCQGFVDTWRVLYTTKESDFLCYDCLPVTCVQCGGPVEEERYCYAHPTCFTCLAPPPELQIFRNTETPEGKAFWDGVEESADTAEGWPDWKKAGINEPS